jgi:hypothetical protein
MLPQSKVWRENQNLVVGTSDNIVSAISTHKSRDDCGDTSLNRVRSAVSPFVRKWKDDKAKNEK